MLKDATGFTHIYLRCGATDMRCGINSLLGIIESSMGLNATEEGSIFLFCGKRRDRIKAVIFEGDGWLLCYKVLNCDGRYQWPKNEVEAKTITSQQFRWLMEGIDIEQKKVLKNTRPDIY